MNENQEETFIKGTSKGILNMKRNQKICPPHLLQPISAAPLIYCNLR
jgi:hypothetical protein